MTSLMINLRRSPRTLLERDGHPGPGPGNLVLVMGRAGVGKTAFIVGIGIDALLSGQKVLHISLERTVDKIRFWYDDLLRAMLKRENKLKHRTSIQLEIERSRHIQTYMGGAFTIDRLRQALDLLASAMDFAPDVIILDRVDFTEIERGIATDLVERFLQMFSKALSKIVAVESKLSGLENNPHYLSGISEASSLLILKFRIKLDTVEGPFQVAMPLSAFGPVREIFDPSDVKESRNSDELKGDRRKILEMVQGSGSDLIVQLGQIETNLENILNLSIGDVLDLTQGVEAPLKIQIAGQDAWLGEAGRVGNQRAIKLIQQLTKE